MPPERNFPELPPAFRWGGPGPVTDYNDVGLIIREIDQELRAPVLAARFEAVAAVHRALADGAMNVAVILAGKRAAK